MANGVGFMPETELIISQLERGTLITKFFTRKRPEKKMLKILRETRQLAWYRTTAENRSLYEGELQLRSVKEIRPGKNSKDFERWPEEAKDIDNLRCFVIFYGSEFKLRALSIAGMIFILFITYFKIFCYCLSFFKNTSIKNFLSK